ncbi:MAG: TonB-dependent receptor [Acidobacteria bacterium]|nr:TonB-dependent receptor [Acidobacteriota bacterium]
MNRHLTLRGRAAAAICCALLLPLFFCPAAFAQVGTSSINGTVVDPQGNTVAGATVTVTDEEKSFTRTQTTNESGNYSFAAVPPGTYRLEVEGAGFKKAAVTNVRALVDKPTEIKVSLEIGALTEESVTVTAGGAQLPLESRNAAQLLSLQAGVTREGYVTGARSDQSNITLDGIDVNEQQQGTAFAPVLRVTTESIEEFRVTTSNPNAALGRSSGAQISLVTKSGTNEWHGSLYEFHRNTVTSANDFFNNRSGVARPSLLRNVFGGSLGGPIAKDRFFFFYSYEGFRESKQTSVVRTVPLASLGRGEVRFPNAAGGITTLTNAQINGLFPLVGTNPAALAVLADAARRYPANDFTIGDSSSDRLLNTAGFRFNAPQPVGLNTHTAKFDFIINDKQTLFLRGNYQHDSSLDAPRFPDTPAPEFWSHPYGIAVGHTWTASNNVVNQFRYGLTRLAFTDGGDSTENSISFRFVFQPRNFTRSLSRVTPVHNFTNDTTWTKGNHGIQFGTNVRVIRNRRTDLSKSFDAAVANPSFYDQSGRVLDRPVTGAGFTIGSGFRSSVQNALSAVIGRFSQYTGSFNYDLEGNILPSGTPIQREFATEEYDFYVQDTWKITPGLTLTYGLRYGLSRPVYETGGFQVKPDRSLGTFLAERIASAEQGRPLNDLIQFELAGPKNNADGFYSLDKNNFQPRVGLAWSPNFKSGFLNKLFGGQGDSVIRGGFAITNDYFGQQLAVTFDQLSTLGFTTDDTVAANTFNVSTRPAPAFTGFGQSVRGLPGISAPNRFQTPADEDQRIESSLDDTLVSPINYSWNLTYERKLPLGMVVSASYIGRKADNLLATRDVMALNNLRDPRSGLDWYTAAGLLHDLRERNTPIESIPNIPYFENLFPGLGASLLGDPTLSATQATYLLVAREDVGGFNILDWTFIQLLLDDESSVVGRNAFFHPQYAAFSAFSTVAYSNYHAGTVTLRQRYRNSLSFDLNYTLSKSMDNASGLQTSGTYGAAFILNPIRPDDNYSVSDFDVRHIVNANASWQLPIGRGRAFLNDAPGVVNAILGGWQLTSIFRYNSGLPAQTPFDAAQWATNWNAQSNGVRTRPVQSNPTRGEDGAAPRLFRNSEEAYRSFRNARPGETGDRNVIRLPGYIVLDMGLNKTFDLPWGESHKLQFRWETFNVTNTQRLDIGTITRANFGLDIDPQLTSPAPVFGNFDQIQGAPRVMQFGLRYSF